MTQKYCTLHSEERIVCPSEQASLFEKFFMENPDKIEDVIKIVQKINSRNSLLEICLTFYMLDKLKLVKANENCNFTGKRIKFCRVASTANQHNIYLLAR